MAAPGPPRRVAVVGAGRASAEEVALAEDVGRRLAAAGVAVICGGLAGVMEGAARGAREAGGLTVGLLPGDDPAAANPWILLPIASGMGEGRNVLVVRAAEGVIAVGGSWGTLSEIALARKIGRPVVTLGTPPSPGLDVPAATDPADAVARIVRAVEGGPAPGS